MTDPARRWLHFIPVRKGPLLPVQAAWLSPDLHLHGTVRDTSQVHPPLGWYGSQLTSTCPPGPASPFTPRPPASLRDYLTYPARLILQLFNNTPPLFTNTSERKTLLLCLVQGCDMRFLKGSEEKHDLSLQILKYWFQTRLH